MIGCKTILKKENLLKNIYFETFFGFDKNASKKI
jgi:hypothetical protein